MGTQLVARQRDWGEMSQVLDGGSLHRTATERVGGNHLGTVQPTEIGHMGGHRILREG